MPTEPENHLFHPFVGYIGKSMRMQSFQYTHTHQIVKTPNNNNCDGNETEMKLVPVHEYTYLYV